MGEDCILLPAILVCEATHVRLCENRTVIIKIEAVFLSQALVVAVCGSSSC